MNDTVEPAPPSEEERTKGQARADLDDILALRKHPGWSRYFLRRLHEKMDPLRYNLLNKRMPVEEYADTLTRLEVLRDLAAILDQDEAGNRSILGILPPG